ncbi:MAG: hypothetical protein R3B06_05775 [Kofleriaceae bacterium]
MTTRLVCALGEQRLIVTITPDPARALRALVRRSGHAVAHLGTPPAGPLGAAVRALAGAGDDAPPGPTAALAVALAAVVQDAAPAATIAITAAPAPPRWSSRLRSGMPPGDALWPFDAELVGLELGLRRLVKRECFSDAAEAIDRAWLAGAGVALVRVGPVEADGRRVLLGARGGAVAAEAVAAELAVRAGPDAAAIATLGRLLGYPACCVARFTAAAGHDDAALVAASAPPAAAAPASPLTQWLTQPLALVSHVPCGLGCAATTALAATLVDQLDRRAPGFAARWRALAARLHVVDGHGRNLALTGTGDLAGGFVITDAVAVVPPDDDQPAPRLEPRPDVVGRTLVAADLVAAADHRGP